MAAFSTIAATAIGAAGVAASVSASKNAKKATQSAAQASQDATDASLQIAREARDATTRELRPYASAGTDALAIIRQMLGLGAEPSDITKQVLAGQGAQVQQQQQDQGFAFTPGDLAMPPNGFGGGGITLEQWRQMLQQRAQQQQQPGAITNQAAPNDPADATPATPATPTGYAGSVFSNLVDDAKATFEDSPWWQFAQEETGRAVDDLDARYGASGLLLSGQGVRARAEIAARLKGEAFDKHYNQRAGAMSDYLSALFGLTDGGRQAASGIGSGGANFANTATQALTNNALIRGNTAIAGAEAANQGTADALGFGGWALGQILTPRTPAPSSSSGSLVPLMPLPQFG